MTSETEGAQPPPPTEQLRFARSGGVPNNPVLPVVLRHDIAAIRNQPAACERLFERHGWGGTWRDGIFPYHHFHSDAHEALGIVRGEATVLLGGPDGKEVTVRAGDVVVLPAGTGHKRLAATSDLLVVGAYPPGQEAFDLRRADPAELDEVSANIAAVPLPETDPVAGAEGPLVVIWNAAAAR
jgi:uncharacterized protein YjlB